MTARAMRATRRMYSTIDAPRSSLANFASSHVRKTNRFIGGDSFCVLSPPLRGPDGVSVQLPSALCVGGLSTDSANRRRPVASVTVRRLVGLTGGIGSGKSTVAALLRAKGATIVDADE